MVRISRTWRQEDLDDIMLTMIAGCWRQNFDIGDIFRMLMTDVNFKKIEDVGDKIKTSTGTYVKTNQFSKIRKQ